MSDERWLFVDAAAAFGGHEVMLLRWLEELSAQGRVTPVLLARAGTQLYEQAQAKVSTLVLPALVQMPRRSSITKLLHALRDAMQVISAIRSCRPTLCVLSEGALLSQALFTVLLRLVSRHVVVYVPLVEPATNMGFGRGALRDWLMRNVYRHVPGAWLTLNTEHARQLAAWSGVRTPIFTLPNTVSPAIEQAAAITAPVQQPLRVLVLGRFDAHQKGLDCLLNTLVRQPQLSEHLHVTLAGDGPYACEIKRRLRDHTMLHRVLTVRPWTPTLQIMREHDVLLLCSRYEGVPLVMLEAMALGLPVVASDLPGTRALLPDDCLFAVGDYRRALDLLFKAADTDWRERVVRRNRDMFVAHASGKSFSHAVGTLTDTLLQWRAATESAVLPPAVTAQDSGYRS